MFSCLSVTDIFIIINILSHNIHRWKPRPPAFLTDKELNKTSTLNSPIFILRIMSAFSLNVANVKYKSFLILDTGDIGFFLFFLSFSCVFRY